jgi:hypothetical protein
MIQIAYDHCQHDCCLAGIFERPADPEPNVKPTPSPDERPELRPVPNGKNDDKGDTGPDWPALRPVPQKTDDDTPPEKNPGGSHRPEVRPDPEQSNVDNDGEVNYVDGEDELPDVTEKRPAPGRSNVDNGGEVNYADGEDELPDLNDVESPTPFPTPTPYSEPTASPTQGAHPIPVQSQDAQKRRQYCKEHGEQTFEYWKDGLWFPIITNKDKEAVHEKNISMAFRKGDRSTFFIKDDEKSKSWIGTRKKGGGGVLLLDFKDMIVLSVKSGRVKFIRCKKE